jgi:ornithine carbamoyltransferase
MAASEGELKGRDFLRVNDWSSGELIAVLDLAGRLKDERAEGIAHRLLPGRTLGMLFEKPSTRTRVSFEVGIAELGGAGLHLGMSELHLGRGEPIRDTALVLSRYLSAIMIRTFRQADVDELAEHADIPVINGLTDDFHPCQALADAMTIRERFGTLEGVRVAYVGDGNNVCHSLMVACAKLGADLAVATPLGYAPSPSVVGWAQAAAASSGGSVETVGDPRAAARHADVLYTDVWTSMGQEAERERRLRDFAGFTVDAALLAEADGDAIVLHCLPAHAGEEIAADVLYGPRSAVWDQAENRLHAQKALLALVVP